LADAAREHKDEGAMLDLLVGRHDLDKFGAVRQLALHLAELCRQTHGRKMRACALIISLGAVSEFRGETECERHADRNRLAMQEPLRISGRGFQRVRESVAEIEERA